tara:strand:- start:296 stop:577 length:282 start_codon:yes stop_codon:yes gene_type:complete
VGLDEVVEDYASTWKWAEGKGAHRCEFVLIRNKIFVYTIMVKELVELLKSKKFKDKLVKKLNDSVDIPFINEKSEEKLIIAILDAVINAVDDN